MSRIITGVGATFVGQFHTKKHYKTAIQSECTLSQVPFSILPVFALKVMHGVILLTWFCKLLTRVAILSGGTCLKCLNGTTPLPAKTAQTFHGCLAETTVLFQFRFSFISFVWTVLCAVLARFARYSFGVLTQ